MVMRLHCERNVVESIISIGVYCKVLESSKRLEIWPSLGKVTSTVHRRMYMGLRDTCAISIRSK